MRDAALLTMVLVRPRFSLSPQTKLSTLHIGVIDADAGDAGDAHARRLGIELGVDEAKHAAALFGGDVQLVTLSPKSAALPAGPALSAIIGDPAMTLADAAERAGIVYMNVGNPDDAWRGPRCAAALFHVMPSAAMMRDTRAAAHAPDGARVEAWHPSLAKFGADTLNDRFRARFNEPMTSAAWMGWFAVKALWESSLRARSVDADKLRAYLARESTQFDGHKGRPISFRVWDRQLRQPVYVVDGTRVTEWPPAGDESARQSLDHIGTPAAATECRA